MSEMGLYALSHLCTLILHNLVDTQAEELPPGRSGHGEIGLAIRKAQI